MPNLAGKLARDFGHLNGYAEGTDGAVFMAAMVSLAFSERDTRVIVKKAAQMVHPDSPYRQCLDMIIEMAEAGKSAQEIADAIEDRWHIEYPATNNAVPNGGLAAVGVWFGEGDFLKTLNIVYRAADFTDADCNAANAVAVVAAMHGMKCFAKNLVEPLHDRIVDSEMGPRAMTPPVEKRFLISQNETLSLARNSPEKRSQNPPPQVFFFRKNTRPLNPKNFWPSPTLRHFWNPIGNLNPPGFGEPGGGFRGFPRILFFKKKFLPPRPPEFAPRGLVVPPNFKNGKIPQPPISHLGPHPPHFLEKRKIFPATHAGEKNTGEGGGPILCAAPKKEQPPRGLYKKILPKKKNWGRIITSRLFPPKKMRGVFL